MRGKWATSFAPLFLMYSLFPRKTADSIPFYCVDTCMALQRNYSITIKFLQKYFVPYIHCIKLCKQHARRKNFFSIWMFLTVCEKCFSPDRVENFNLSSVRQLHEHHSRLRVPTTPILWKPSPIFLISFFQILSIPLPCSLQLPLPLLLCCLVSLAQQVIAPYGSKHMKSWYLTTKNSSLCILRNKASCFLTSDT